MENIDKTSQIKILALVTLYNPNRSKALYNISLYKNDISKLIVWDNSEECHESWFRNDDTILYHWTGENTYIATAINYAWKYAKKINFDCILLMDQDSQWIDFSQYYKCIGERYLKNKNQVFTPYILGNDKFTITQLVMSRRVFINSGTVIPIHILDTIGGADETFPIDALDNDLSYRILSSGFEIVCITSCKLNHIIGSPNKSNMLHIFTNNYGRFRTYSITRSHIICYRKHHRIMTLNECYAFYKEFFFWKIVRILFAEDDKWGRFCEFCKGIRDGISFDMKE